MIDSYYNWYKDYILILVFSTIFICLGSISLYWVTAFSNCHEVKDGVREVCITDYNNDFFLRNVQNTDPSKRFIVNSDISVERFLIKYVYLSRDTSRGMSESLSEIAAAFSYGYVNDDSDDSVINALRRKDNLRICTRILVSDVKLLDYNNDEYEPSAVLSWKEVLFYNVSKNPINREYRGRIKLRKFSNDNKNGNSTGFYVYSVTIDDITMLVCD